MMASQEKVGTFKFYLVGFVLCVVLTLAAYYLVAEHLLAGETLILAILGLGAIQMAVQLIFFMHLGSEPEEPGGSKKAHWNLLVFFFMVMVIVIVVFGSLWIMYTLNYREMPPMDMSHAEVQK
jgi:cytochrome o ubiquinol oxidase operon protein cyoD